MKLAWSAFLLSLSLLFPASIAVGQTPIEETPTDETLEVKIETTYSDEISTSNVDLSASFQLETAETSTPLSNDTAEVDFLGDTASLEENLKDETFTFTKPPSLAQNPEEDTLEVEAEPVNSSPEDDVEEMETENQDTEETEDPETEETEEVEDLLELTEEEKAINQLLQEGDRLLQEGDTEAATEKYQEAKEPFDIEGEDEEYLVLEEAFSDPENLSPAGSVYWENHLEGVESNLDSKIFAPIELLIEEQPAFIPGYISYMQTLRDRNRIDEAVEIADIATSRYPDEPELVALAVEVQNQAENWLEASLTARQFAMFNPDHPQTEEFLQLADENWERYQGHLRGKLTQNAIANVLTGAVGFVLTGNLGGPISAVQSTMLLLQGEERVGEAFTRRILERAPMLKDEEVLSYVREIGHKLTEVAGRDEFDYEFHVLLDEDLNAFALPGGKVFINAGAIAKTNSEAELAGLLAHEISHAVLSHGFQLVTQGQLTSSVVGYIPFVGGLATNLIVFSYSRDMERQADHLGTRILAASGYAADGMRNLMETLGEQDNPSPPEWLSTHPDVESRVRYLEELILNNSYNRYNYEGVDRHTRIRERVNRFLREKEEEEGEE